ncbi:MAG: hypothetical protein EA352_11140 [Gemmatimonadales bacterium]|nr:MAG: hypothetical protein EA352_11140 [Gemmatimonadales bacterium]
MFENLRSAFREAVDNFRTELNRDAVPEAADRLLKAMKGELVQARSRLDALEGQLATTRRELASESAALETCIRREEMAHRIGDSDTEEVARDFARRHLQRRDLLEEKEKVLVRELDQARTELTEMEDRFRDARTRRESLVAQAGRTDARTRIDEAEALFGELDRMAQRIDHFGHRVSADGEVEEALSGETGDTAADDTRRSDDVDARLAALKRQMGRADP